MDNAGTSAYNKEELVKLAAGVLATVKSCGLQNRGTAFRIPVADLRSFEEKESKLLPDLPPREKMVKDWEVLRNFLPEISKAVILRFLKEVNPLVVPESRVWTKALQRVLDMGSLPRLWATPPEDGIMWIGFR